ncbi:MAG: polysaccharide biosynthesis protein [Leptospiraceae bacterium]|nr:polysaccharide biosynthesis protein [Leptospiraceae bacterium]
MYISNKHITEWLVRFKIPIVFTVDLGLSILAFCAAFFIRLDQDLPSIWSNPGFLIALALATAIQMTVFWFAGLYRGIWRFSSIPDLVRIVLATTFGVSLTALVVFFWNRLGGIPRSIFIIDWLMLVVGLGGVRFSYRIWRDSFHPSFENRAIIVGAGRAGEQLYRELRHNSALNTGVVGFVDDEPALRGKYLHGVPILGEIRDLSELVNRTGATDILIAIPSISSERLRSIVDSCAELGVNVKRLPDLSSFVSGRIFVNQLKDVGPEDLLRRKPVELNRQSMAEMLRGKRVLVTGAGGSIGSEICRQILQFGPACLILIEQTELFLYEIEKQLSELTSQIPIHYIIADVRNESVINTIFHEKRPEVVFHAAAYKHVPLMETNPWYAVQNNVGGTRNVARAAGKYQSERFVLISTDKAVNPTNVMGATKRICEMVCMDLQESELQTRFIAVRFGNVLGSTGSVIPLFKRQIEEGGPVTVTHPDVRRYFMSIPEAVQLVMQAAAMGVGGEVFVLEMGEPVRILDLAREMIALSGHIPDRDIKIKFTGLRPGEKLYEELLTGAESTMTTSHPGVRIARLSKNAADFQDLLQGLLRLPVKTSDTELIRTIQLLVPEYGPSVELNKKQLRLVQ